MKPLLLIAALFSSLTLVGQEKRFIQNILIGYAISPDYSFRTLKNNDARLSTGMVIENRNNHEIARLGYTTGLNALFVFSPHIGVETGIQFSNRGYTTKKQYLVFSSPNSDLPIKSKLTYSYNYIGIPIKAKYTFGKNKIRFVAGAGLQANFLLNAKTTAHFEYADGKAEKKIQNTTSVFNKMDISPIISMGVDYTPEPKIHLFIEPNFRYGLITTKDAPVKQYLWNAGLNLGIYYVLK